MWTVLALSNETTWYFHCPLASSSSALPVVWSMFVTPSAWNSNVLMGLYEELYQMVAMFFLGLLYWRFEKSVWLLASASSPTDLAQISTVMAEKPPISESGSSA